MVESRVQSDKHRGGSLFHQGTLGKQVTGIAHQKLTGLKQEGKLPAKIGAKFGEARTQLFTQLLYIGLNVVCFVWHLKTAAQIDVLQIGEFFGRFKQDFGTTDEYIDVQDVRTSVHVESFHPQALALHHAQGVRQLVDADAKLGVNVPDTDFFVAASHEVRVDAEANGYVFVVQAPVFQHGDGVYVDFDTDLCSFFKLGHGGEVRRKQDVLRGKTGHNTESDLFDGHTVQTGTPAFEQAHDG